MPNGTAVHSDSKLTVPNAVTVLRMVMALVAAVCFATGRAESRAEKSS